MKTLLLFTLFAFTFSLHGQNRVESSVEEYFDGISWIKQYGYDYVYDNNKNLINEHSYEWTNTGWEKDGEVICTYNSNNKITEEIEMGLNMLGQFENIEKTNYIYAASGQLNQMISHEWDGSQWESYSRQNFIYTNSKLTRIDFEEYDGLLWETWGRYVFNYSGNLVTSLTLEEFDGALWEETVKISFTYGSNNKKNNTIYEYFDGSNWVEFENVHFDLDASLNRIKQSYWYSGVEDYHTEYTYDLTQQLSNYAHPFNYSIGIDTLVEDFPYVNKILSYTENEFDQSSGTFYVTDRTTFNYNSQLVLGLEENIKIQNISLYPNPAVNFIQINGISNAEKIVVVDVLGAVAFEKTIQDKEKVNIENLTNGLYLIKFENGKTLKFVKK